MIRSNEKYLGYLRVVSQIILENPFEIIQKLYIRLVISIIFRLIKGHTAIIRVMVLKLISVNIFSYFEIFVTNKTNVSSL